MASSHGADRISARRDLGDNPRLVLIAPCPPPPGAGKHLQPADWLRDSTMFSVHSKPSGQNQTADSQISTSSGRGSQTTAYHKWGESLGGCRRRYPVAVGAARCARHDRHYIVQSPESPGGMGEAGTALIVPAVTNASCAATGKRVRKMPVDPEELKHA